jgi:peptide/nickel transport system substrate-binding protein
MTFKQSMPRAVTALVLLAGGAQAALAQSSIKVQLGADIRSTNPGVDRDGDTDAVVGHFVEGLVAYGENATVKPLLAESVSRSDDGLTYTFSLRHGVKFHNGEEMTSADVLWSWNRYMDPDTGWRCLPEFDGRKGFKVEKVDAPDPYTVTFRVNQPNALFLNTLARTDCGMTAVLNKASVKADGSWDKPIGTGPFELGEWRRGEYIELKRFADYAGLEGERDGLAGGKEALVDEVRFMIIPDAATAKAALLSGDIDVIPDVSSGDVKEFKQNPDLTLSVSQNMGLVGLLLQTKDPLFSSVKMRQALAAAIDCNQLVAAATEGLGQCNNSIVPATSPYYTDVEKSGWTYDPAKAQSLLKEAGYDGQEIVMIANKHYPAMYQVAVIAQAMLKAAGINVRLDIMDWATQLDRYSQGNYQMMSFSYSARLDPALGYESISGDKAEQPRKVWDNADARAVIQKAMVVTDQAERQKLFDSLHKQFIADVPMVMLYNGISAAVTSKRVQGFQTWPGGTPRLWGISIVQ